MVHAKISIYILAYGLHRAVFMPDLFYYDYFLLALSRICPVVYVYIFSVGPSLNSLHIWHICWVQHICQKSLGLSWFFIAHAGAASDGVHHFYARGMVWKFLGLLGLNFYLFMWFLTKAIVPGGPHQVVFPRILARNGLWGILTGWCSRIRKSFYALTGCQPVSAMAIHQILRLCWSMGGALHSLNCPRWSSVWVQAAARSVHFTGELISPRQIPRFCPAKIICWALLDGPGIDKWIQFFLVVEILLQSLLVFLHHFLVQDLKILLVVAELVFRGQIIRISVSWIHLRIFRKSAQFLGRIGHFGTFRIIYCPETLYLSEIQILFNESWRLGLGQILSKIHLILKMVLISALLFKFFLTWKCWCSRVLLIDIYRFFGLSHHCLQLFLFFLYFQPELLLLQNLVLKLNFDQSIAIRLRIRLWLLRLWHRRTSAKDLSACWPPPAGLTLGRRNWTQTFIHLFVPEGDLGRLGASCWSGILLSIFHFYFIFIGFSKNIIFF